MECVEKTIYLAGKITPWSRAYAEDWRFSIVPRLAECIDAQWLQGSITPQGQWHYLPKAIFGRFGYVGPFFTDLSDYFGGHGGGLSYPHGLDTAQSDLADPRLYGHGDAGLHASRHQVTALCLDAVRRADLVFAWIERPDCYGTLFELGYAKALGKPVAMFLCCEEPPDVMSDAERTFEETPHPFGDLWFPYYACGGAQAQGTPKETLERVVLELGWFHLLDTYDSPLEAAFASEWVKQALHLVYPLTTQHPIKDGRYRLDFAYLPLQVGIELDGYTYHSDREAFTKDRQRQREIESHGWRMLRFSGDELRNNLARCVQEAAHFLSLHQHKERTS